MMSNQDIGEHSEIIGKDGVHVGTVNRVEGHRIKLTKADSPAGHKGHHHFIKLSLVETVTEGRIYSMSPESGLRFRGKDMLKQRTKACRVNPFSRYTL
jgi:hypothetical protein